MKALSVRQPWAWCIVNGYKPVENRSRMTKFRGSLLIHASLKYDIIGDAWIRANCPDVPLPPREEIERGGIVGRVTVIGAISEATILVCSIFNIHPNWRRWFFGPFAYVVEDAEPLPFRPYKGMLGFFEVK